MIEVKALTKKYDAHLAVDNLSFTIEPGHIYGFLGPNGAGKSTTMNIVTGCLAATSGSVTINGHDIYEDAKAAKKCIGYLPEQPPVYMDMTPREYLRFVGQAKGLHGSALMDQVFLAMRRAGIVHVQNQLIRTLSKGYRQRVGIAQALLGEPEIIILDEPTVGLDPAQIIEIRDLIRDLGRDHTVILSSHILQEVSAVCDQVIIIAHGKLVANDSQEDLIRRLSSASANVLRVDVRADEQAVRDAVSHLPGLDDLVFEPTEEPDVRTAVICSKPECDLREAVFFALAGAKIPVRALSQQEISLEDAFLELTGGEAEPVVQTGADATETEEKDA